MPIVVLDADPTADIVNTRIHAVWHCGKEVAGSFDIRALAGGLRRTPCRFTAYRPRPPGAPSCCPCYACSRVCTWSNSSSLMP